jgi:hypothetical protein
MSEGKQRLTRPLSRETAQLMLQMKDLLRKYGIAISLSAPNVYDIMLQAAETIDDVEIRSLYHRLIDNPQLVREIPSNSTTEDEENPCIDEVVETPVARLPRVKPVVATDDAPALAQGTSLAELQPETSSVRDAHVPEPLVEEELNVFLEREETSSLITKRVALHTPRTGLLRCDRCQRTHTVMAVSSPEEPVEIQCPCGMMYQAILDSRKYDRKVVHLLGGYVDQNDNTKSGTIVIENMSFGGLKFRLTSPQKLAYNDVLNMQFTLDDKAQTRIREKVRVHYVNRAIVGAEFVDLDKLSENLSSYLMS